MASIIGSNKKLPGGQAMFGMILTPKQCHCWQLCQYLRCWIVATSFKLSMSQLKKMQQLLTAFGAEWVWRLTPNMWIVCSLETYLVICDVYFPLFNLFPIWFPIRMFPILIRVNFSTTRLFINLHTQDRRSILLYSFGYHVSPD